MNVSTKSVEQLVIDGADRLDQIRVIFEPLGKNDSGSHRGALTVSVYGRAWTTYWGGMSHPLRESVALGFDTAYIVDRLIDREIVITQKAEKRETAYLTRIVDAIKQALRQEAERAAAPVELHHV